MRISLRSFSGDLTVIELGTPEVNALRESVANLLGTEDHPLTKYNVILLRQQGHWERLGNFHTLQEGDEVAYFIRDDPSITLTGSKTNAHCIWCFRTAEKPLMVQFMNRTFTMVSRCSMSKTLGKKYNQLEDMLYDQNEWMPKYSEGQIADMVHLWDVKGM